MLQDEGERRRGLAAMAILAIEEYLLHPSLSPFPLLPCAIFVNLLKACLSSSVISSREERERERDFLSSSSRHYEKKNRESKTVFGILRLTAEFLPLLLFLGATRSTAATSGRGNIAFGIGDDDDLSFAIEAGGKKRKARGNYSFLLPFTDFQRGGGGRKRSFFPLFPLFPPLSHPFGIFFSLLLPSRSLNGSGGFLLLVFFLLALNREERKRETAMEVAGVGRRRSETGISKKPHHHLSIEKRGRRGGGGVWEC